MSTDTIEQPPLDVARVQRGLDAIFEPATPVISPTQIEEKKIETKVELPAKVEKAEKVEPVVKVEVKTDEPPEDLPNEGRKEIWKKFTAAHKETKAKLTELQGQLSDFDGTKKERDELKGKIADYEKTIGELKQVDSLVRLENDPDFKAKYVTPRDKAILGLKEQAEYGEIDNSELLTAINKSGKDRVTSLEALLADAPSIVKTKIISYIDQIDALDSQKKDELANAQESLTKRQQEREKTTQAQKDEYLKSAENVFKATSETLAKEFGIDEAIITKAREFYTKNNDLSKASEIIIKGMFADTLRGTNTEQAKKITELESELAKFRESSPGLGAGGNGSSGVKDTDDFVSAIRKGAQNVRIF